MEVLNNASMPLTGRFDMMAMGVLQSLPSLPVGGLPGSCAWRPVSEPGTRRQTSSSLLQGRFTLALTLP